MNVQQLIGEVARRHNVLVDPDDPIFIAVTLDELLLAEHLQRVQLALSQAEQAAALASGRHVESAKLAAAQLMMDGARHVSDQVRVVGSALRKELEHLVRDHVMTAQMAAAESVHHRRTSQWCAAIAVACACLVMGIAGGLWLGHWR